MKAENAKLRSESIITDNASDDLMLVDCGIADCPTLRSGSIAHRHSRKFVFCNGDKIIGIFYNAKTRMLHLRERIEQTYQDDSDSDWNWKPIVTISFAANQEMEKKPNE